jgi:uncharacterized protein
MTRHEIRAELVDGLALEARGEGELPRIVGLAAVYYRKGNPGTQFELWRGAVERVMPGAFDKVLADGTDTRALLNHDANLILGRTKSGTLRLSSEAKGLRFEIDPPDTQVGRDAIESIRRGDLDGSSFAFTIGSETWRDEKGTEVREIDEVSRLYDVAVVTYPAYAATSAAVRAESAQEARASWEAWRRARASVAAEAVRTRARAAELA